MTKWKGWKAVIRDVIIIWILLSVGRFIIGVATAGSDITHDNDWLIKFYFGNRRVLHPQMLDSD